MSEPVRRRRRRFYLSLPLSVRMWRPWEDPSSMRQMPAAVEDTTTENVSSGGCYFLLSYHPTVGSDVEMELTIPIPTPGGISNKIRCRGKVARVERGRTGDKVGVVSTIEEYEFLNPSAVSVPGVLSFSGKSSHG